MNKVTRFLIPLALGAVYLPTVAASGQTVEVGPYVQFTGPHTAVVRWDTDSACNSIVEYGTTDALGLRTENASSTTTHEVTLNNLQYRTQYYFRAGYNDGSDHFTPIYWQGRTGECGFDNSINYTRLDCSSVSSPYPTDSLTTLYTAAADHIITQTGKTKGYCLVYGCGEGRLAFEIAKRTDMMVVGVEEDANKVNTARQKLMQAGVYGARVTVRQVSSLSSLPFTKYFFNLIVSDHMISSGECVGSAAEMFRVLRPSGGTAYLGQPAGCPNVLTQTELENWLDAGSLTYTTTIDSNGLWSEVTRGEVTGAGWWSQQYGGPDNAGNSYDDLEGASRTSDMDIQWIGWPGADSGVDRNPRMPAPVAKNGRLFHQGLNRIMTIDSYNGAILWSLEIPLLRRVNMPRDAGNLCADDDYLFAAVDDDCWRLDGDTGHRSLTFKLNDNGKEWGLVSRYGNNLYGTAQRDGAHYENFWGGPGWYDGGSDAGTYKVCGKYIFARNAATGADAWPSNPQYPSNGNGCIINTTICIGGNRVYFVESRDSTAQNDADGRLGAELWNALWLVALNADTGALVWQQSISPVAGIPVFYMMYHDEILVLESSNYSAGNYYLYAYRADNGGYKWGTSQGSATGNHGQHMQRAVILSDNNVYLWDKAYALSDGSVVRSSGVPRGTCGTTSGASSVLLYRPHSNINMWHNSGVDTNWSGIRPGCWLNVISGGGMVLAPESGGGCSCNVWYNTSVGFVRTE